MAKRYARQPGSDQVAKWKQAVAERNRNQRRNRWKREPTAYRPGMNIIQPPGSPGPNRSA
jgi:hypothetical protein